MVKMVVSFDAENKTYKCEKTFNEDPLLLEIVTPKQQTIYLPRWQGDNKRDDANRLPVGLTNYKPIATFIRSGDVSFKYYHPIQRKWFFVRKTTKTDQETIDFIANSIKIDIIQYALEYDLKYAM